MAQRQAGTPCFTGNSINSMTFPSHHHLCVSAPGRVCLFGEHQDYLGLPVIACAISLRVTVTGSHIASPHLDLALPDIGSAEAFPLDCILPYGKERDYLRSAANVVHRHGYAHSRGIRGVVHGNIPINTGTSSSSALIVAWTDFLVRMSDRGEALPALDVARLAHEAEVLEFKEPGGMMDHIAAAVGGIAAIDFVPSVAVTPLDVPLTTFVLGDSREPKDTTAILARVKNQVVAIVRDLKLQNPEFDLHTVDAQSLERYTTGLPAEQAALLAGTLRNRDVTQAARALLVRGQISPEQLGSLLWDHQRILRDVLRISTPKIDRMLDAALQAGAHGGKINGSGGGGCMFVYAPDHPEAVAAAIEREGGKAYIVTPDEGVRTEVGTAAGAAP